MYKYNIPIHRACAYANSCTNIDRVSLKVRPSSVIWHIRILSHISHPINKNSQLYKYFHLDCATFNIYKYIDTCHRKIIRNTLAR